MKTVKKGSYHFHRIPYGTEAEFKAHIRIDENELVIMDCTTPDGVRHEGTVIKRGDHGLTDNE